MALINNDIYVFVKTETLSREAETTSHTVPIGSITDNVRTKNPKLELTGSIVDVGTTKADTILSALETLYENFSNVKYQGRHTFYSALIKSLETKADPDNAGGYTFNMELEQLRTVAMPYEKAKASTGVASTGVAQVASTGSAIYHVVKSGDTLYTIAQQYYGDSKRFIDIYNANKNTIKSDYSLTVGQQILIP
ncbi:MAG: LysM peptidoglycan-binding domain-containing protein [Ruminococcus sp.]|uniref:LysM peptidoglycan-binding domain-containing protein n=1 Tax=Ruminococcus sp. TaxID=41978 RepID=UPI002872E7E5|nr:LysM domain-containing protein [Ruminococcus sp.]MBQ3285386.1 LysM peptidoglycan-binding domain-containing protein [Ruminococcus sp.]